jgi:hypothetical protein
MPVCQDPKPCHRSGADLYCGNCIESLHQSHSHLIGYPTSRRPEIEEGIPVGANTKFAGLPLPLAVLPCLYFAAAVGLSTAGSLSRTDRTVSASSSA